MSYFPDSQDCVEIHYLWFERFDEFLAWYIKALPPESDFDSPIKLKIHCHLAFDELCNEWLGDTNWRAAFINYTTRKESQENL